jgi:hypothetical protein
MIHTGFETRVKVQQIIENQLPEFILDESPNTVEFLKQYYISQEYQGAPTDIAENLDQYLKLDNLTPEVVVGFTSLSENITPTSGIVTVSSTKGFPSKYGLIKIDDEIITYTGITTNTFTGCIRGFSGITSYHRSNNPEELVFSTSISNSHSNGVSVQNLSTLFLKEFYKKLKYSLTPGLEDLDFVSDLNVGNFIKNAKSFYQSKGTDESFRILFNVLYGVTPKIVNLENLLNKPSSADYVRREVVVAEAISGDPINLIGQSIVKSTDLNTNASVSDVQIMSHQGRIYHKIFLFIGYNDSSAVTGTFNITPSTRVISANSSVITVDSTIGFPSSGKIVYDGTTITYTSKSINQFFGCTSIPSSGIPSASIVRSDEYYYGYGNGNTSNIVKLRITGVLSEFIPLTENYNTSEGEEIYVKNIGEVIKNTGKDRKEILSNSLIYNTSTRYQVESINGTDFVLYSTPDKSSIKVGDFVDILESGTENIQQSTQNIPYVNRIEDNKITLGNLSGLPLGFPNTNEKYDIRRRINTSSSSIVPIIFGNNTVTSDIQNVYLDDSSLYVAFNSLPSYTISKNVIRYTLNDATANIQIQGYSSTTEDWSIISFVDNSLSFITGDKIYYEAELTPIIGLSVGIYYVEIQSSPNQIKLYTSPSFIGSNQYVTFKPLPENSGEHYFTLYSQKDTTIGPQKLLKKFPIESNIQDGTSELTIPGSTGMLINGVEILNYKSEDKIYYGPLESIEVLNGGTGYDVINLPEISISSSNGTTALAQPVIRGSVDKILVDPQEFEVNSVVSIAITGGNGSGAVFEPIIQKKRRELEFDARESTNSGGIDVISETLTFLTDHKLVNGDPIVYNSNGNFEIGIGNFGGSNLDQNTTLQDGTIYYPQIVNSKTIKLYNSLVNYSSGINTIGFTTSNTTGIHKFETVSQKNTITEIKVLDGGVGYENRKLIVNPSSISITENTVTYKNHNFNDGELIAYEYQTTPISGLSTSNQYYVIKINDNTFKLSSAGIGGTDKSNYDRKKYVNFNSIGSGYQIFKYPDIEVTVKYSVIGSGIGNTLTSTPIVRGSIVDMYLYESGTEYGSTVLNLHKKPIITIKNGSNANLTPIIINGKIDAVNVQYGGIEYYSTPELVTVSSTGSGAVLRPIITNGKISEVVVINPGINYNENDTTIKVISAGLNAILNSNVRSLTVNNHYRFGDEILRQTENNLQYSVCGYSPNLKNYFDDPNTVTGHSPIIGWAYDGNPIYGPYGYSSAWDTSSTTRLVSGYILNTSNITNRPSGFNSGFFIEDYSFVNYNNLDSNNGRFGKTPEFPNGVYAYFATIDSELNSTFPYFIGNTYRSNYITDNYTLNQNFDFNNSTLIRNTFPYKVSDQYAGNDFIFESNEVINGKSIIESVSKGSVESFKIIDGGDQYKINDRLIVDNTNTGGGGLDAIVSNLYGKEIVSVDTTVETYQNSIFTRKDVNNIQITILPYHNLSSGDNIVISGLTTSLSQINKLHTINIISDSIVSLSSTLPASVGIVTDIYVTQVPESVSVGSTITIENETLSVLNIFNSSNVLRVKRGSIGISHSTTTPINLIPNSFIISESTEYFDSKVNDKVFFNPTQSIGIGSSIGVSTSINFVFASNTFTREIPTQSIYIENHPFTTNQEVILRKPNGTSALLVNAIFGQSPFSLPLTGDFQKVYINKKTKDTIGIKTSLTSTELFFLTSGSNDYEYSLESNYEQVTGKIEKIKSTVSISTSHNLSNGDQIDLVVNPNLSVGIGTSSSVYVKFNSQKQKLIINPLGFNSTGINTSSNTITINSHNLNTGDKILYSYTDLAASGLSTGSYYVYKIDDNNLKLSETYIDSKKNPPTIVSIASTGGKYQQISPINPKISVIKNNDLVFNLSDTTLNGYNFKLFYDETFNDEFVSTGTNSTASILSIGSVGVSTNASLTLKYTSDLPTNLFYALEKSGYISTSDREVSSGSQITFVDSDYIGSYKISGVGTTTFEISLIKTPEKLNYVQSDCDILKYSTNSQTANGSINKVKILSSGLNYKNIPTITGVESINGSGSYIVPKSNQIGKINQIKITNESYEYSSDKTLRPTAYISPQIIIDSSNTISNIEVISGGKNYIEAPDLIIIDSDTRKKINGGLIEAVITSNSITSTNILDNPKGLPPTVEIFTINNSNGIPINTIESSSSGIVTCYLTTPINAFTIPPFQSGDKIFVEGIQKFSTDGSGFNSEDYEYQFFTITSFTNTNPAKLEYSVAGLTTNPGIAKTAQESFANIINYKNYPQFNVTLTYSYFSEGEQIYTQSGNLFVERDLYIVSSNNSFIKVFGSYDLSVGESIRGSQTGTIAKINTINEIYGQFEVNYSSKQNLGWSNDVGKLDEDHQVISDNDYYQNLSYAIKSPITFDKLITPVNNLVHTSGLKNFADTEVMSTVSVGIGSSSIATKVYDIFDEKRVDTINNFDLGRDLNTYDSKSKFISLKNKKLIPYINCVTNRVLKIDDISSQFSNSGSLDSYQNNLIEILPSDTYNKFLVQVLNTDESEIQLSEVTVLNDGNNLFTIENSYLGNTEYKISDISGYVDEITGSSFLKFTPIDQYNKDYDIKILRDNFNTNSAGIGTTSIGFINLTGSNLNINSGLTSSIISVQSNKFTSLYSNIQVINSTTNEMNFVELYLSHDGNTPYVSEYYIDSNYVSNNFSSNFIGSFGASISSGILSLTYTNTSNDTVKIRSKIVGFGSTAIGSGTYRFKTNGQLDGAERTSIYSSSHGNISGISTIFSFDSTTFLSLKSTIQLSIGSTSALHQVSLVHDNTNISTLQYPFLSIGSTNGIGTFGGEYSGSNVILKFYPNSGISGIITTKLFTEIFYKQSDIVNKPEDLTFGTLTNSYDIVEYNSINGLRLQKTYFDLNYSGYPIFKKVFNPTNSSVLNPVTGEFTLVNHFFSDGEKITYTPKSTFIGIGQSSLLIGPSTILPSTVYVHKLSDDTFKLSTTKSNALSGICVTFTSYGEGNAHELEMEKKLERTIITLDNLIQYPITYTPISYTLFGNGGQISDSSEIFKLSGISSIRSEDLLKIENEYVKVVNVGLGTTNVGPISNTGSNLLVQVSRGFVGSSATSHTDSTTVTVYRGSYNITGNKIYFTEPPTGDTGNLLNSSNLPYQKSEFSGRVFLRQDYSTNQLYDNISDKFTGIGQTYSLTVGGINTVGLGTSGGNGIVFLNNIFQSPSTQNNTNNNFNIIEDTNVGISSIVFTGITSVNGSIIKSVDDVNQNQLPRGGLIVSLGSTTGLGYAPLVGASVTAVVSGGSIISVGLGTTDVLGSGYYGNVSIGITDFSKTSGTNAVITASVGAGGTLAFTVVNGGSGYVNPVIITPSPSYSNLPVIGVSRLGIGLTTQTGTGLLLNLSVGASSTTGIGSTLFEISKFSISRSGYGFNKGDIIKPVGLVTARGISSPLQEFQLEVLDTFNDSFASWQFGELDYIDSIENLQNGTRVTFPLNYNSLLLSFQKDDNSRIDFNSLLLIFINGVIQEPGSAYEFTGGSTFTFTTAPSYEDKVSIFFYRGSRDIDSKADSNIWETIKIGDEIKLLKNSTGSTPEQNLRTIYNIASSDTLETNLYDNQGVDSINYRPLNWTKQKRDQKINEQFIYKTRDSIESMIYPTAKIIGSFSTTDDKIFVDDAQFFHYENQSPIKFDSLVVNGISTDAIGSVELITNINSIEGSSGIVTGITTSTGIGVPLALKFYLNSTETLTVGNPIYIFNTNIGKGVTSIYNSNTSIVGIGTTFLDNIYNVSAYSLNGSVGIVTCNILSTTSTIGLSTSGLYVGEFSWGKLSGFTRSSSPISIGVTGNTVDVGLSTFPTIQRRGYGLRNTGSLRKTL